VWEHWIGFRFQARLSWEIRYKYRSRISENHTQSKLERRKITSKDQKDCQDIKSSLTLKDILLKATFKLKVNTTMFILAFRWSSWF
jgi:hypothetical protein